MRVVLASLFPLTRLLASDGYLGLFVFVGVESLGIPLPGETALVTAAAFAAMGHLSIYLVIATAAAAAIVGDNSGYWIGRKGGIRLVRRYGRILHVREREMERAHTFFERHGAKAVFFGRFIALLRMWAPVLAGVSAMQYRLFVPYNALGGMLWSVLLGTLGYVFGRNLPKLEHYLGRFTVLLLILAVIAASWFVVRRFRARSGAPVGER